MNGPAVQGRGCVDMKNCLRPQLLVAAAALAAPHRSRALALLLACLAALAALVPSRALSQDGSGGTTTVDVYRSPVVASSRVTGLAGAYTGIAEGSQGAAFNPASFANRYPFSVDWFDYDWNLDWVLLAPGADIDFDNDGRASSAAEKFNAVNVAAGLQLGRFGMGIMIDINNIQLEGQDGKTSFSANYGYLGFAYAFWREQLLAGLGFSTSSMLLSDTAVDESVKWETPGLDVGLLFRPLGSNWRVGASFRRHVLVAPAKDQEAPDGLDPPDRLSVPWRLSVGASWFSNKSGYPYNTERDLRERDLEMMERSKLLETLDRRYILVALDVRVHGAAPDGSRSMAAFLSSVDPVESGQSVSVSVHAGAEAEVMSNRLVVRAGAYYEPPRIQAASPRGHGTGGADVRVGELLWWQWKLGLTLDLAPDYYNSILSLGFWH